MQEQFPTTVTVPANWLHDSESGQLINLNMLASVKGINNDTKCRLTYFNGMKIEVALSPVMLTFIMNEALVAAMLEAPDKALLQKYKAENAILKQKLAKLEANV